MRQPYVLHYWGIKARGYLPALIAKVGGFPMDWDKTPDWPAIKPRSPTGQLPFMEGPNGLCIGQSGAIVRFIARKTGLDGATDEEFAMSEQLIQQAEDLYTCLAKAHYAGGGARRTEEMDALYGHVLPPLLDVLERMLPRETTRGRSDSLSSTSTSDPRGRDPVKIDNNNNKSRSKREQSPVVTIESLQEEDEHAHTFTGRVLAGDLAVYVALDLLVSLQADCLSQHPTILNFYLALNRIEKIREVGSPLQPYFRRYSDPRSGDVSPTLRPISPPFVFNSNITSSRMPRASSSSTSSTRECSSSPTRKPESDFLVPPKPSSPRTHSLSSSHQISPTAGRFAPMAGDDLQYHSPTSHHNNHNNHSREARLLRSSSSERDRERHHRPHHSNSRSRSNSRARDHGGEHAEPSEMSGDSPRLKEKCDLNVHISSAPTVAPDRLRRSQHQHRKSDAADALSPSSKPSSKSMELIVLDSAKAHMSAPTLSVVRSNSGGKDKEKEKEKDQK